MSKSKQANTKVYAFSSLWNVILSIYILSIYYSDVIMSAMESQITSLTIVYSTVYSGSAQRKHQSSASLAFVRGIHLWPVNSPHKRPVMRKILPFDDVIMSSTIVITLPSPPLYSPSYFGRHYTMMCGIKISSIIYSKEVFVIVMNWSFSHVSSQLGRKEYSAQP